MYDTERKIKNQIIRNIKFALARKKVPEEIIDQIDLEAYVDVEPSTVKAYERAPTRKAKGEILSELYHETLSKLMEAYPVLKQYFKPHSLREVEEDQRRFIESMWDLYARAEAGDEVAEQTIKDMGYTLEEFRRLLEKESKELEELESVGGVSEKESKEERKTVAEAAERYPMETQETQKQKEEQKTGTIKPLTAFTEAEEEVKEPEKEYGESHESHHSTQPSLHPSLRPLIEDMLKYVCRSMFLGAGYSVREAISKCKEFQWDISSLVDEVMNGTLSREEAVERLQDLIRTGLNVITVEPFEEVEEEREETKREKRRPTRREVVEEKRRRRKEEKEERGGELPLFKSLTAEDILKDYGCVLLRYGFRYFIRHHRGDIGLFTPQAEVYIQAELARAVRDWGEKLMRNSKKGIDMLVGMVLSDWPDIVVERGIREAVWKDWDNLRILIMQEYPEVYTTVGSDLPLMIMGRALHLAGCLNTEMPDDIRRAYLQYVRLYGD